MRLASSAIACALCACDGSLYVDTDRIAAGDSSLREDAIATDSSIAADSAMDGAVSDVVDESAPTDAIAADVFFPCTNDPSCKLVTLHCDSRTGQCVPCLIDADCTTKERKRCDVSLHRCVECGLTADCPPGDVCEPSTRKCVKVCPDAGPCPAATPTCDTLRGFCVACIDEAACGKKHCELGSGRCLDCTIDTQCPKDRPRCDIVTGHCVICVTSADCAATKPLCDPTLGVCVTG